MFTQQLRCNDSVSELFKEMCVLSPAKSTMESDLSKCRVLVARPNEGLGAIEYRASIV